MLFPYTVEQRTIDGIATYVAIRCVDWVDTPIRIKLGVWRSAEQATAYLGVLLAKARLKNSCSFPLPLF